MYAVNIRQSLDTQHDTLCNFKSVFAIQYKLMLLALINLTSQKWTEVSLRQEVCCLVGQQEYCVLLEDLKVHTDNRLTNVFFYF